MTEEGYVFVDAWIERIAITPELRRQLNTDNANRYQIFIDNDIWYDAIDKLAEIQQTSELEKTHWNQLLSNLGLPDLIEKNVLDIRANSPVK